MRSYAKVKFNIVMIQSFIRMTSVVLYLEHMNAETEKVSDYQSKHCFVHSRQRTASSIKIQSIYRMYTLRKKYVVEKMQVDGLDRYEKRINQVNGTVEATSDVEVDLEMYNTTWLCNCGGQSL